MDLGAIIAGLRLPTKTLVGVCIATGILLFADEKLLVQIGLSTITNDYRGGIGVAFIASLCLTLTTLLFAVGAFVKPWLVQAIWVRQHKGRLHQLNPDEKRILAYYFENQTRSQTLPVQDGTVNGLVAEKIIVRLSSLGSIRGFAYNIQPWAWDYLNKKPHLLD